MIRFIKINNKKFEFQLLKNVFEPNLTTILLIRSLERDLKNKDILELGCGCGIISKYLLQNKLINRKIFLSDVSRSAIKNSKINLKKFEGKFECKISNLFSNWDSDKKKFDIIIDDVSAISQKLKTLTPWFKNISLASGNDGTKLTIEFLKNAKYFLKKNGSVYFPVLSLSNVKKIKKFATAKYKKVEVINEIEWPLPLSMQSKLKILNSYKKKSYIDFKLMNGILTAKTKIYKASI